MMIFPSSIFPFCGFALASELFISAGRIVPGSSTRNSAGPRKPASLIFLHTFVTPFFFMIIGLCPLRYLHREAFDCLSDLTTEIIKGFVHG